MAEAEKKENSKKKELIAVLSRVFDADTVALTLQAIANADNKRRKTSSKGELSKRPKLNLRDLNQASLSRFNIAAPQFDAWVAQTLVSEDGLGEIEGIV